MDDFVCNKLTEWNLSDLIETFKENKVTERALFCLTDEEIKALIPYQGDKAIFREELRLLKESIKVTEVEVSEPLPSTSNAGKRKLDSQSVSCDVQPAAKRQPETNSSEETQIKNYVKNIMENILKRLQRQRQQTKDCTTLNNFLETRIKALRKDKKELVGVFGRIGAGKSSLINAVIGEENLLPSGDNGACTSVMIKVEANRENSDYIAEIEFITQAEWTEELWSMSRLFRDTPEMQKDEVNKQEYEDIIEKLTALYGEEPETGWFSKDLVENYPKYTKDIPKFISCEKKTMHFLSANELSEKIFEYTRNCKGGSDKRKNYFWPLVKCVTIRVPNNNYLQHVTLVDLPGNGDCNKSRDEMWKKIVGECSNVWIVADISRAADEKEPWEILDSATSLLGNGGECRQIHFICTKSDIIKGSRDSSASETETRIVSRNEKTKEDVKKKFLKQPNAKKHFNTDCFKVYTVSSEEFQRQEILSPQNTEIPMLQDFLKTLNDCHSETLNYVSGAHGILSLIQGARIIGKAGKNKTVFEALEKNLGHQLDSIKKAIDETSKAFEQNLTEGVNKSKLSWESLLEPFVSRKKDGRGYHRTLRCLVENSGIHKPKKGRLLNINQKLSSYLTDSIDEEFRKTFPNDQTCGPFNGVIKSFSLGTDELLESNKHLELEMIFLKTEEEKLKTDLSQIIRDRKKEIYNNLTETIKGTMRDCYKRAAECRGKNSMETMMDIIKNHVAQSKDTMFDQVKDVLLEDLKNLRNEILKTLENTMKESIDHSLKTDDHLIPDVSKELMAVKELYNKLKRLSDEKNA